MNRVRWVEVAEVVQKMIEAGELQPGDLTPTAVSLSALTGAHRETCRKALLMMARSGELDPPVSRSGRPRVPGGDGPGPAERQLAAALVAARRAARLTQEELAERAGLSVATLHCAETGRFRRPALRTWARLDRAAGAGGELLRMHGAWQASRNGERRPRDGTATLGSVPGPSLGPHRAGGVSWLRSPR